MISNEEITKKLLECLDKQEKILNALEYVLLVKENKKLEDIKLLKFLDEFEAIKKS